VIGVSIRGIFHHYLLGYCTSGVFNLPPRGCLLCPELAAVLLQKVESGIFGTSGSTGFTKENEVFVGRVAMLGFAVRHLHMPHTCASFFESYRWKRPTRVRPPTECLPLSKYVAAHSAVNLVEVEFNRPEVEVDMYG
jgi:hypothetical protein